MLKLKWLTHIELNAIEQRMNLLMNSTQFAVLAVLELNRLRGRGVVFNDRFGPFIRYSCATLACSYLIVWL